MSLKTTLRLVESGRHVVPCGSGELALNFRRKMRLFNVSVPFILSHFDDDSREIRHYSHLHGIGDIDNYSFVFCEEAEHFHGLYEPLRIALQKIARDQAKKLDFLNFSIFKTLECINGRQCFDIHAHRVYLDAGKPFTLYGGDSSGIGIHIFDSSVGTDMTKYTRRTWPEFLHNALAENGVEASVYNWSMSNHNPGNSIVKIIRDARQYKPDIVVFTTNIGILDNLRVRTGASNMLKTRVDTLLPQWQAAAIHARYRHPTSTGCEFPETRGMIYRMQLAAMRSLAASLGFTYLNILLPQAELLPFHLGVQIPGMRKSYLERMHSLRAHLADLPVEILDHSHLFDDEEDVYDCFLEWRHFTTRGSEMFGRRVAADIMSILKKQAGGI